MKQVVKPGLRGIEGGERLSGYLGSDNGEDVKGSFTRALRQVAGL